MKLEKAQQLKVGDTVHCPADRGEPAYNGKVTWIGERVANVYNSTVQYIWVEVQRPGSHKSNWPSNRLG